MIIYLDKLAHIQVVINCRFSIAQLCTREDTLAHNLGALYFDDVMSYSDKLAHIQVVINCRYASSRPN